MYGMMCGRTCGVSRYRQDPWGVALWAGPLGVSRGVPRCGVPRVVAIRNGIGRTLGASRYRQDPMVPRVVCLAWWPSLALWWCLALRAGPLESAVWAGLLVSRVIVRVPWCLVVVVPLVPRGMGRTLGVSHYGQDSWCLVLP